jgi:hypothetical protein
MNAGSCWGKNTIDQRGHGVEKPRKATLTFFFFNSGLSLGFCYRAGMCMDLSVDLLLSVRIKRISFWGSVGAVWYQCIGSYVRYVWKHNILFLLSDGIFRCVYVADVFLVRCWSVVACVLAAGLFYLRKDSLYVFMSRSCVARHYKH